MMKRFAILPLGLLLIASCKEKGPAIDFGPRASDTAYMSTVATPQQRVVLVEEFTGVTCPNCPQGHTVLKSIEDANAGRIAAIGIQVFNNTQTGPVDKDGVLTQHDNRTQAGTDLQTGIYGEIAGIGLPGAGIDRAATSGSSIYQVRQQWTSSVANRLTVPTRANVSITHQYNTSNRQATITVRVSYTGSIAIGQSLNVALVENDIVDAQEDGLTKVQNYTHEHVLRDILTNPTGTAILTGVNIQPGQVYERTFTYTVNAAWNPDNCRIVAYVANNNGNDKEVQQAAEVPLK